MFFRDSGKIILWIGIDFLTTGEGEMAMYFFATQWELPEGVGFSLFGPIHLAWIGAIGVGTALGLLLLQGRPRAQAVAAKVGAVLSVLLVLLLEVWFWWRDDFTVWSLPLHLCELTPFLLLLFELTRWDWVGQTLYCLCLPGSVAALLFPNWTMFPQWNVVNLQGFLLHALLVFCPLLELQRGAIVPRFGHMWKAWVFLAVVTPPIYLFNLRFGTNYFFLNAGSPGSPLEWLIVRMGNPGFLLGYAAIALAVTAGMYLPRLFGGYK